MFIKSIKSVSMNCPAYRHREADIGQGNSFYR